MKILHLYKGYHPIPGGIENHVQSLAELQAAAGHLVTVMVTNPGGQPARESLNGVKVIRLARLATIASTPLSLGFLRQIPRLNPDITHLHFPYPVAEVSQRLAGKLRPYVITYHSDVIRQRAILRLYDPFLRQILSTARRIIATSASYIRTSPYLSEFEKKCVVVPLSVDADRFRGVDPLIPPGDLPTLLFMGRHRYYKGVEGLLLAARDLPVRLVIGGEGPLRASWQRQAAELAYGNRAIFTGDVQPVDLPRLYASADIFVLPATSRAEAFGTVLLEAMAAGLPCITTEVGTGTSEVVQDGRTGLVVSPGNMELLKAAILSLANDPAQRRAYGMAGQDRVRESFSPARMLAGVLEAYEP